jgi:hypothetical protein
MTSDLGVLFVDAIDEVYLERWSATDFDETLELIRSSGRVDKPYATLVFVKQASNEVGLS